MSLNARMSRLAPALTAQERAILVLEAWKAGRPEDPSWRTRMPPEQTKSFSHYIDLMNRANRVLGRLINGLASQIDTLEQREGWLLSETIWEDHIKEIRRAIRLLVKEPITQSEYESALARSREEWVPLEEIAGFLAGKRDYADDDCQEIEGYGRVEEEVDWERAAAEEEQRLRDLAATGRIESRGKGKRIELRHGVIHDFGYDLSAMPEDWLSYRVVPDEHAEEVELERHHLRRIQRVLGGHPGDSDTGDSSCIPPSMIEALQGATAYWLIETWRLLRRIEVMVGEIGEEFNGSDPLKPVFREKLNSARDRLKAICEHLPYLNMKVVLLEPTPEEINQMRDWLYSLPATD